MDVQVAESGPCRKTLTIKVSPDKIKEHIDQAYKSASQQVQIKGFRPGKVPRKILQQRYGEAILAEAKEELVNASFESAIKDADIKFVGRPDVEGLDESPLAEDQELSFQVHLDIAPDLELKSVRGIEIKAEDPSVTDEDVEKGLQQLADSKKKLEKTTDPAEDGDFVKANLQFEKDGEVILERKGAQLHSAIPVAGTDPQLFTEKVRGAEPGNKLELELTYPEGFEKEEARGAKGTVKIEVLEVLRMQAPELNDELAKTFDFDTLDALKAELTTRIGEEKETNEKARQEGEIIDALLAQYTFPLPQSLVADQKKHMLQQLEQQIKERGADEAQIKQAIEENDAEADTEAERRVRVFFLLEAIAKKEKLFVTEGDVDVELRNIASQNQVDLGQVKEYYESNDMLGDLRLSLMERKVRDFLRENAKITDK